MINTAIADTTDIVNDQALPERWHREVTRSVRRHLDERRGEAAKRLVLQRLDRLIAQVERGTVMQGETRDFAMERLREVRERWGGARLAGDSGGRRAAVVRRAQGGEWAGRRAVDRGRSADRQSPERPSHSSASASHTNDCM